MRIRTGFSISEVFMNPLVVPAPVRGCLKSSNVLILPPKTMKSSERNCMTFTPVRAVTGSLPGFGSTSARFGGIMVPVSGLIDWP